MKFNQTPLDGAFTIELEPIEDERGYFSRLFCVSEFAKAGLETTFVQSNLCLNAKSGIVRGMHFQAGNDAEVKLVRCIRGAIYDVIVDIRPYSATYLHWFSAELSEQNSFAIYVPRGFAHGYQSLSDGALVMYMVSDFYSPLAECGMRHDDPAIGIHWPYPVAAISTKDANWPLIKVAK